MKRYCAKSEVTHRVLAYDSSSRAGSCERVENDKDKDEEDDLCVNCDISYSVPRSPRRTRVFYIILSKRRQLNVQRAETRHRRRQFPVESTEYSVKTDIVVNNTFDKLLR
jgi:hypothetical protein